MHHEPAQALSRRPHRAPQPIFEAGSAQAVAQSIAQGIANDCRRLVRQRSLFAAGVSVVPIPALDWFTDVSILLKLLPEINRAFGLSPAQIARLTPERQVLVYKAISVGGGMLAGKVVTKTLVLGLLKAVGVRLSAQQAAKFVPLAGQAVSAVLTYSALSHVCEQHIRQCQLIFEELAPLGLGYNAASVGV